MDSDIALLEVTQHAIMNKARPTPDGSKVIAVYCLPTDARRIVCAAWATTWHRPRCFTAPVSSGEQFECRAREFRQSSSVVGGIILRANCRSDDETKAHSLRKSVPQSGIGDDVINARLETCPWPRHGENATPKVKGLFRVACVYFARSVVRCPSCAKRRANGPTPWIWSKVAFSPHAGHPARRRRAPPYRLQKPAS